jgi:hypothetical protein
MWSEICRILNFVVMILAGLFFLAMIVVTFFNMPNIFTDSSLREHILGSVNSAGVIFWVMAWWWQSGTISRLKGEIKDKTLMW